MFPLIPVIEIIPVVDGVLKGIGIAKAVDAVLSDDDD